ncbi:ArpU family phage packaging/lysis transcriptional regulator, partial [Bacillus licheniformis]
EKKYLTAARVKDINIYMDLGITKNAYYRLKKRAIYRLATALGII